MLPGQMMEHASPEIRSGRITAALAARLRRLVDTLRPQASGCRADAVLARMSRLPFASTGAILGEGTALILAPHPDDESLGCGGLIAEACALGRPPRVAVLTDGAMSHPASSRFPAGRLRALREAETLAAVAALGLPPDRVHFLGLPDGQAPRAGAAMAHAAARLAGLAHACGARTILATWSHDPHPDHVAAQAIARRAALLSGARLLSYPVWGWALPPRQRLAVAAVHGVRLDITRHLPAKRRAIEAHASQIGGLIDDDPNGFRLPGHLLAAVGRPFEVFLSEP
jgi:LmbE family N-acetylglucosaminyl deacetylase